MEKKLLSSLKFKEDHNLITSFDPTVFLYRALLICLCLHTEKSYNNNIVVVSAFTIWLWSYECICWFIWHEERIAMISIFSKSNLSCNILCAKETGHLQWEVLKGTLQKKQNTNKILFHVDIKCTDIGHTQKIN